MTARDVTEDYFEVADEGRIYFTELCDRNSVVVVGYEPPAHLVRGRASPSMIRIDVRRLAWSQRELEARELDERRFRSVAGAEWVWVDE